MEYLSDEEFDSSWIESQKANFDLLGVINGDEAEESWFESVFGETTRNDSVVSFEENVVQNNGKILYDNVIVEDISSDEQVDSM